MTNLIKISDVAEKYGVTTRTLRFYETAGLIRSQRTDAYAYRMYDETALKRLEQILILRRMSISVKDIKRIFESAGSEVVLDVLDGKAKDIDEEVALLHELKGIVLKFIRQIKQADFSKEADIQLLYEQAEKIEEQIDDEDLARLAEVSEKLSETILKKFEFDEDLLLTIHIYFESGRDIVQTAEKLSVHRNTVHYRLQKIKEVWKQFPET